MWQRRLLVHADAKFTVFTHVGIRYLLVFILFSLLPYQWDYKKYSSSQVICIPIRYTDKNC